MNVENVAILKSQRPFLSVGKGGLQSGQMLTSRNATKPIRLARNGHPALGDSPNAPGFDFSLRLPAIPNPWRTPTRR